MVEVNKSYVYRHFRLDDDSVFYIGFSEGNLKNYHRAKTKYGRNIHWTRVANKYGFRYEIVAENLSTEDAKELEVFLISLYGRQDIGLGRLVNMADGGEGNLGYIPSEKVKKEQSERMKGKGNPFYGKSHTQETIDKILTNRKTYRGEEHFNWGKVYSEEERAKMRGLRPSVTGCSNPNAKKVINIVTLEIFCSIAEAAKAINMSPALLGKNLNSANINKTDFIYFKDYEEGFIKTEYIHPIKVRVLQKSTGTIFESISEVARHLNIDRSRFDYDLKKGRLEDYEIL